MNYKIIQWIARVWAILSLGFLLYMIGGHIFGSEPQNFNNTKEIIAFVFFPIGLILGLVIGLRKERIGGVIAVLSMIIFFICTPNALGGIWFYILGAPGLILLIYSFLDKNSASKE